MRISILTPTFNSLAHLRGCVASVRTQAVSGTTLSIHHQIHDARSTDGTREFLDGLAGEADGYRLAYRVEADDGMYDALNRAFAATDGEIVGHLNSDEQYSEPKRSPRRWNPHRPSSESGRASSSAPPAFHLA